MVVTARIGTLSAGNSRQLGFTLLELMIVLVIAAIMMAVVPPMISSVLPGAELKSAARSVAAGLRYARNKSLTSDKEVILMLDLESKRFNIGGRKKNFQIHKDLDVTLLTAESEMVAEDKGAIRFFPDGGSTGGRISLSTDKRKYAIDVDWLTGKVRIFETEAGG